MASILNVTLNKKPVYDIHIDNSWEQLRPLLTDLGYEGRKVLIVTDSNVGPLYENAIKEAIGDLCSKVVSHTFPAGEESKNLDTMTGILDVLVEEHFDRKDFILALGGGVTGDMAGFAASVYMRGIAVIQVPTSLLSQVDSSIGGKTAVDYKQYKNMVGAFYMPKLVYINTKTLETLSDRQFYSGMAEVLKYGLIMDASFYEWILDKMYEIFEKDPAVLEEMILTSCACKQKIVERDPYEHGDRALLNFGHTIGHAIEKAKNFTLFHGECVALGCVAAAYISWKKDKLSMDEYYEIRDMFVPFNLPISIDDIDPEEILRYTKSDKKQDGNTTRYILLKKVGKAFIDTTVTDEEALNAIREIYFSEEDEKA